MGPAGPRRIDAHGPKALGGNGSEHRRKRANDVETIQRRSGWILNAQNSAAGWTEPVRGFGVYQ